MKPLSTSWYGITHFYKSNSFSSRQNWYYMFTSYDSSYSVYEICSFRLQLACFTLKVKEKKVRCGYWAVDFLNHRPRSWKWRNYLMVVKPVIHVNKFISPVESLNLNVLDHRTDRNSNRFRSSFGRIWTIFVQISDKFWTDIGCFLADL
jgi:hypothetical protein